jgi:protein TonB
MCQLCFRILTALLTFAVGVGASALWGLWRTPSAPQAAPGVGVFVAAPSVRIAPETVYEAPTLQHADWGARTVAGGILNHKAVSRFVPDYPAAAKQKGVQGAVVVRVVVGTDGRVETAQAVSGPVLLRQAAADAVSRWRFSPTLLSGEAVRVAGVVTVNFTLQ